MRAGFRLAIVIAGVVVLGGIFGSFLLLQSYSRTLDFRLLAEEKVGELLKAKVTIEKIHIGFFNKVVLSGIKVESTSLKDEAYKVQVGELVFRYDLLQLLTHNLKLPSNIVLKAPSLLFDEEGFPYHFFENLHSSPGNGLGIAIRFDGGQIRCFVPGIKSYVTVKNIQGSVEPRSQGDLFVDLRGTARGFISGHMRVHGIVRPLAQSHDLEVDLSHFSITEAVAVPIDEMKGTVRWENDNMYFKQISAKFHGWDFELKGETLRLSGEPLFRIILHAGRKKADFDLTLKTDFASQELDGQLRLFDKPYAGFRGKIRRDDLRFTVTQLLLNEAYRGGLVFDMKSSQLNLDLEKERRRISIVTNLKDLAVRLKLQLDHVDLFGMDLVTFAQINLTPIGIGDPRFKWKFNGDFETQYFVLHTLPFDDFHGHFEAGPDGIKNISAFWGEVFRMEGELAIRKKVPYGKLTIHTNGFDLSKVKEFAAKPLPKELGGMLDGKLRFEGDLTKPEIYGNFSVTDGRIGKLKYDRGLFSCRGFPPYVPLQDSKILRGRTTLYLKGSLNFSSMDLTKMFRAVEMQTTDKIVIWKGWEITSSAEEQDFEVAQKFVKLPTLAVKTGLGANETSPTEKNKDQEEQYVAVGPKIKF
jgi:hypothetical protein